MTVSCTITRGQHSPHSPLNTSWSASHLPSNLNPQVYLLLHSISSLVKAQTALHVSELDVIVSSVAVFLRDIQICCNLMQILISSGCRSDLWSVCETFVITRAALTVYSVFFTFVITRAELTVYSVFFTFVITRAALTVYSVFFTFVITRLHWQCILYKLSYLRGSVFRVHHWLVTVPRSPPTNYSPIVTGDGVRFIICTQADTPHICRNTWPLPRLQYSPQIKLRGQNAIRGKQVSWKWWC